MSGPPLHANPWGSSGEEHTVKEHVTAEYSSDVEQEVDKGERYNIIQSDSLDSLPFSNTIQVHEDPWGSNSESLSTPAIIYQSSQFQSPESAIAYQSPTSILSISQYSQLKAGCEITVSLTSESKTLFGHHTYIINNGEYEVSRRYSDFLWLQDTLLKKFPNRIITALPPKRGRGNDFLERRRRGLSRFLNFLACHPIVSKDEIFTSFLKVKTPIRQFKNGQMVWYGEEHEVNLVEDGHLDNVPSTFDDLLRQYKTRVGNQISFICQILDILERMALRMSDTGRDFDQLGLILQRDARREDCLAADCVNCGYFEEETTKISQGMFLLAKEYAEETREMVVIDKVKSYRDALTGFQMLTKRSDVMITQLSMTMLSRRINVNKNRIVEMTAKGSAAREIDKLSSAVEEDEKEIESQQWKQRFIRYCLFREFLLVHDLKSVLLNHLKDGITNQILHSSAHLELWSLLCSNMH